MKYRNKIILCALAASITFSSCSDYLDIPQEDETPQEILDLTDPVYVSGLVSGTYAAMRKITAWGPYSLLPQRADDFTSGGRPGDLNLQRSVDNFDYSTLADTWPGTTFYGDYYSIVTSANENIAALELIIEGADTEEGLASAHEGKAELQVLRAFAYFMMMSIYDGVPLITQYTDLSVNHPRTTRDGILQYIIDEMDDAAQYLPEITPGQASRPGAVTMPTALAVKAKAALYLKDYETVLEATQPIVNMGIQLYPEYRDLFKKTAMLCDESLLEIQFTDFGDGGEEINDDNWFALQGPYNYVVSYDASGNPILNSDGSFLVADDASTVQGMSGWGAMSPSQSYMDFMIANDDSVRYEGTVLMEGVTRDNDTIAFKDILVDQGYPIYYNYKAYTPSSEILPGRTGYGDGNSVRLLRYADVLLMQAEAKIMLGQNGDAEINEVRTRAKQSSISGATIDDLLNERLAEFCGEWSWRFWDLVRNDKAEDVLGPLGYVAADNMFFPYPTSEIDTNPLLLDEPIEYVPEN